MAHSETVLSLLIQVTRSRDEVKIKMQDIKTLQIYKPVSWDAALSILQQFYVVNTVSEQTDDLPQ